MLYNFKNILLLLISFFYFSFLHSQRENNIWNIGYSRAINFNNDSAELIETEGRLFTRGYNSSISDAEGNLLFYSNGINIWDSNHEIMPNGNFIANGGSHAKIMHSLILSVPNREKQYYLFTLSGNLNLSLTYSIVDMNLNQGRGDVHPDFRDIPLLNDLTGILIAAKGVCGSLWIVTHGLNNNQFFAHEINGGGIEEPIITSIGSRHTNIFSLMSFSPDSKNTAVTTSLDRTAELLEFNPSTGELFNVLNLPIHRNTNTTIGSCFSPDGSKLYIGESRGIFQYNLALSNPQDLIDSKVHIPTSADNLGFFLMQRTPDEKIYIQARDSGIDAILLPNLAGLDCTYEEGILNRNDCCVNYFQNLVVLSDIASQKDSLLLPQDTQLCQNTQLTLQIQAEGDTYRWQDGSTTKDYEITTPGTYWVEVQKGNCTFTDTLKILPDESLVELGQDTILCQDEVLTIEVAAQNGSRYEWQDGSTNPDLTISTAGLYWVESTDSLCSYRDSILVKIEEIVVALPEDTALCPNQNLFLNVAETGVDYEWQDGSNQATFSVSAAGLYWVEAQKGTCSIRDSLIVSIREEALFLPNDTILCNVSDYLIIPDSSFKNIIWWQSPLSGDSLLVTTSGTYHALPVNNNCFYDSITVTFQEVTLALPTDTILCMEDDFLLDVGILNGQLTWQDGSTDQQFLITESGLYWASLTKDNCMASDSIEVSIAPLTVDLGQDTTLCEKESLALTINIPNGNYEWQDGSQAQNYTITQTGTYWAKITKDNCVTTDSILVNFTPQPTIDLGADTTLCTEETLTLIAPTILTIYQWQDGTTNTPQLVTTSGNYWLEGAIDNCIVQDSIFVTFETCPENTQFCQAYLPNSFSPNGDGINDGLQLLTDCELQFFEMEVYDRWGSLVFSTTDVRQAWDGTANGELLDTGVYLWTVRYQFVEQDLPVEKVETVTIIR